MYRPNGINAALVRPVEPAEDALTIWLAFQAHRAANAVFVAGRDVDEFIARDLHGVAFDDPIDPSTRWHDPSAPVGWDEVECELDLDARRLSLRARGLERTAVDHGRHGCIVLAEGESELDLPLSPVPPPTGSSSRPEEPWPFGDAIDTGGLSAGVDLEAIEAAVRDVVADGLGRAIVVAHQGRLIAEAYGRPFNRMDRHPSWSATKSFVGALVGRLIHEGHLELDQPAPIPAWQEPGDRRGAITVDHLLRLSSGIDCANGLTPWAEGDRHFRVYGGLPDVFGYATSLPLLAEPGTRCAYQNCDVLAGAQVVLDTAERIGIPRIEAPWRLLFDPLGMDSVALGADPTGNFILSGWSTVSALDWARFGQLYLDDGVWQGRRLLPEGWLDYATTPAPADEEPVYGGAMMWLGSKLYAETGVDLPERMALAAGHRGQRTFVLPEQDLVIVRMGHGDDELLLARTIARIAEIVSG